MRSCCESSYCDCPEEGTIFGIGNPLLDISAPVTPEFLQKYGLNADDAIMAEEKHMPLYQELVENFKSEFIAGGSVLNTFRVAQWILEKKLICTYVGCVGNDSYGEILKRKALDDGVNVEYQTTDKAPTGTCAVLLTKTHRSLVANLAAAQHFTPDHLETETCKALVDKARFFYTSGYFIAVSVETTMNLAKHAAEKGYWFGLNLSAPFVSQMYKTELEKLIPYVDLIIGNETEAEAFATAFNFGQVTVQQIAEKISVMEKINTIRHRVVVITQGCNPVITVRNKKVRLTPVEKISNEEIVDSNGAGDAFAGGFLSQFIKDKPLNVCVYCGIYAASHILKNAGCTYAGKSHFVDRW